MSKHLGKGLASGRAERGLALVEFTIVVPILLVLIMATAEFGRAFQQYNALTKSVQDAARYVAGRALLGSTGTVSIPAALQTEGRNLVVYGNVFGTGAPVLPGLTPAQVSVVNAGSNNVSVTVAYPYDSVFAFVPAFFYGSDWSGPYTFQAAVTMRAL